MMDGGGTLPREVIKWLQSLDLSFQIKNPKRDMTNGFIVAEIMTRYHPKEVSMNTYENGTRLGCKVDNWEQLFKLFRRKGLQIAKYDVDPVIHCAPGAAISFLFKLYQCLTKRAVKVFSQMEQPVVPAFARDTASTRLKDHEISRIEDNVERTIRAIDTLGMYHEERRHMKAFEAPFLVQHEKKMKSLKAGEEADADRAQDDLLGESVQVDEVTVKALQDVAQIKVPGREGETAGAGKTQKNKLTALGAQRKSAVGALATLQHPALFAKPAADIMRPLVTGIINEAEELSKIIDSRKDVMVSFMEHCRDSVPEEISVRVFETLSTRAQLLVDTLIKSPPEFWKVWSLLYPALVDFSESSVVFESVVFLFKRIGDLMRETDPGLTQQLISEVGLPSLAKLLRTAPEKRDSICEIVYCYTQQDTLNHLLVLRALKERVDNLPVYVSSLSCLVSMDAELGLLDEHLLDLYIYYALVAQQSPQPKIRVAGLSILSSIAAGSNHHKSLVTLIPSFAQLASDDWWEVQAQLLQLASHLLGRITMSVQASDRRESPGNEDEMVDGEDAADGERDLPKAGGGGGGGGGDGSEGDEEAVEGLLGIIGRVFVVSNSKNVLQVGLSALVHVLGDYPMLFPMYVSVLLDQPPEMRRRLLRPHEEQGVDLPVGKLTYVMGNCSRMYEERCVSDLWPHIDAAKTFSMQLETSPLDHFELEHMEVLSASLPPVFDEMQADEWLDIFEKVKQYIFVALVDPDLHHLSTQIIRRFWLCPVDRIATRSLEASKRTLLQALRILYNMERTKVDEAAMLEFLRDMHHQGGNVQLELRSVVDSFQETHPDEFANSGLASVFM